MINNIIFVKLALKVKSIINMIMDYGILMIIVVLRINVNKEYIIIFL